jgi:bifunctional DNA-binding transcriptional regulator/antitoxin component of YhaV-PrlF toxin-antitoxin module
MKTVNTRQTLDVDKRGRVALPQKVFDHLGVEPGADLNLTYLPNGECMLEAARPTGSKSGVVILRRHRGESESGGD